MESSRQPKPWGKRLIIVWLVIALIVIGFYFLGAWTGYFGSYDPILRPLTRPIGSQISNGVMLILPVSALLAAVTLYIWKRTSNHD